MQDLSDLDSLTDQPPVVSGRTDGRHRPRHPRAADRRGCRGQRLRPCATSSRSEGHRDAAAGVRRAAPADATGDAPAGRALLRDIATRQSARTGPRETRHAGAAGDRTGSTRRAASGDTEPWHIPRTVSIAVPRTVLDGGDISAGVRLETRRRRGRRDRAAHAGRRRPPRRHVVLDGPRRPLGSDEAHRAGPASPHLDDASAVTPCS